MSLRTAVELFSGMGSFAEACRGQIRIVSAFDQNAYANTVYKHNFTDTPNHITLDSISSREIPDADIWWMSPPCTPYSVRGKRADLQDPRAKSLVNLIKIIPDKVPQFIFLENVRGFANSRAWALFLKTLNELQYSVQEMQLCATDFGIPMRRPRHFIVASRITELQPFKVRSGDFQRLSIKEFIDESFDENLLMPSADFEKYEDCLNVIDPEDPSAICICFTKGYYQCRLASGSLIKLSGRWLGRVRRFSSREILKLFGFSSAYEFHPGTSEEAATRLLGNAVDVRAVRALLEYAELLSPLMPMKASDTAKGSHSEREPSAFNRNAH